MRLMLVQGLWLWCFAVLPAVVQGQSFDYMIDSTESLVLKDNKTEIPNIGKLSHIPRGPLKRMCF
jgi:hypothetical protein